MRHSGSVSQKTRVAVLCGGWSSEREVSQKSGAAVIAALQRKGYDAIEVDPVKDLTRFAGQLIAARPDVIFNALHGTGGEDGVIAGALEMTGIPYTHSDCRTSAIAMDKKITKIIAASLGITIAADKIMKRHELKSGHPFLPPYVVKPLNEGSSVGVSIIHNSQEEALKGDENAELMVERFIPGDELTVGVIDTENGAEILGITKLQPKSMFYDYRAKYTDGMTAHIVNPAMPANVTEALKDAALKIHKALGCRDVSRSDFRYNPADGVVFLEVNTHPGMTDLSLVPEQAAAKGLAFDDLVVTIIEKALQRGDMQRDALSDQTDAAENVTVEKEASSMNA